MNQKTSMTLRLAAAFTCGLIAACALHVAWTSPRSAADDEGPFGAALALCVRQARADLDAGEYEFFPNRRSIWVVNRSNGRMAMYFFHDDEAGSVDRSRVATIDLRAFPREDTDIRLSDKNLNNILWVCNRRTGDVQMWTPGRDGALKPESPITTSSDLIERRAAGN